MATTSTGQLRSALAGDPAAFGAVVVQYQPLVYSVLLSIVRRREPLDDLAQDVFIKAWGARASLREPARFSSWLAQIARRRALDWYESEKVRAGAEQIVERESWNTLPEAPDELAHRHKLSDAMWQAMDRLDDDARQLLLLRHVEGCSYRDIARFVEIPTVRAYNQIRRAEKALARDVVGQLRGHERPARQRQALAVSVLGALALESSAQSTPFVPAVPVAPAAHAAWKVAAACIGISAAVHLSGVWKFDALFGQDQQTGALHVIDTPESIGSTTRLAGSAPTLQASSLPRLQDAVDLPELEPTSVAAPAAMPTAPALMLAQTDSAAGSATRINMTAEDVEDTAAVTDPSTSQLHVALRSLRLRGAGTFSGAGNFLDDLSRFLPTCCGVTAEVVGTRQTYGFFDPNLLAAPIHFLFQGGGEAALNIHDQLRLSPDEETLLGQYLAEDGFLYFEGDAQYLRLAAELLHRIAPEGARLVSVPQDHTIYTEAFDLTGGFPGEHSRSRSDSLWAARWELPPVDVQTIGWAALWGLEVDGKLLAVLTRQSMFRRWQPDIFATKSDSIAPPIKVPLLRAAANIVVYAVSKRQGAL